MMELIVRRVRYLETTKEMKDDSYRFDETTGTFEPQLPVDIVALKESIKEMIFLTGNKNKLVELEANLQLKNHISLSCPNKKLELAEIQDSSILNIVQDKCRRACDHIGGCQHETSLSESGNNNHSRVILVEDSSLNFEALNGMPGPYVKWFMDAIGPEGLFKMLSGFSSRAAEAICIYALMVLSGAQKQTLDDSSPPGEETILFFRGMAHGRIVEPRKGGWGWDPIFEEERSGLSFAEMDLATKSKFSHRANALKVLQAYFEL